MIYLDNTSTTSPKPETVCYAVESCIRKSYGSPGRSAGSSAKKEDVIYGTRELISQMINGQDPNQVIFTCSATDSLNLAIKGFLKKNDHVITTNLEHNSVLRPLKHMELEGTIELSIINSDMDGFINADDIIPLIKDNTRLIIATHASNVIGTITPIERIGRIAKDHGIKFLVDCSQTAGIIPINVQLMNIDMLAMAGHKGLFGPSGTGALYIGKDIDLLPLRYGGTGTVSESMTQPETLPHKYESGTANLIGISGMNAGIKFISNEGMNKIRSHEVELTEYFHKGLASIPGVITYGTRDAAVKTSVISMNIKNKPAAETGSILLDKHNIISRVGLHCAPLVHKMLGTDKTGTVRFGIGYFNTKIEIEYALNSIDRICSSI